MHCASGLHDENILALLSTRSLRGSRLDIAHHRMIFFNLNRRCSSVG